MTTTTHLGITLLESSQAQKEITINEGFSTIDALLKGSVKDKDLSTPPSSPTAGDVYIVANGATGEWAGKAKAIAYYDLVWRFITPTQGLRVWVSDEQSGYEFNGTDWQASNPAGGGGGIVGDVPFSNIAQIGANTVLANATGSTADISTVALGSSQLLGRGASGNIAPISLGSGLTMTGTTLSSSGSSGGSSAGTVIASGAFPAAAVLDVTDIPSSFSNIGIFFESVTCSVATRELQIRASGNNGASFASTAGDYRGNKQAGASVAAKARATLVEHAATGGVGSVRTGSLFIFCYQTMLYPQFNFFLNDGVTMWSGVGQLSVSNLNALRFMWDGSGNFSGGTYKIIGF